MRKFVGTLTLALLGSALTMAETNYVIEPGGEPGGSGSTWIYEMGSGSYLGIDTQEVTSDRVGALKLKEERGVEIVMVDQDAPASKAGLKEHDVILELNGTRVEGVEQLRRLLHEIPPGRTVSLAISRDGQPLTVPVKLADRAKIFSNAKFMHAPKVAIPFPPEPPMSPEMAMPAFDLNVMYGVRTGALVENLTPQLGEYFGIKSGEGVLIRSIEKGSPAEAAGLRAGDVVVRVEKEHIANRGDWRMAMRAHNSGKVAVAVVRDRREQTFTMTLPEKSKDTSQIFQFAVPEEMELENLQLDDLDFGADLDPQELMDIREDALDQAARVMAQNKKIIRKTMASVLEKNKKALREAQQSIKQYFEME